MKIRAPGRICLFGEHQDYLGFPVIAGAIDRYIFIESRPSKEPVFNIEMPDILNKEILPLSSTNDLPYANNRDYLRSVYNILRRKGLRWSSGNGHNIKLTGNIPINAGASSSSAMVIAWIYYLLQAANKEISRRDISELGFISEVKEFGESGGSMDHYSSAMGGIIYMHPSPNFVLKSFPRCEKYLENSFILIDSEQNKSTVDDLRRIKDLALKSFTSFAKVYAHFNKFSTRLSEIESNINKIDPKLHKILIGSLTTRDITSKALDIIEKGEKDGFSEWDKKKIGLLFQEHHQNLSQRIGNSTEKIDNIVEFCLENGAYGAKVNGSGFGGTLFAYCPKNRDDLLDKLFAEGFEGISNRNFFRCMYLLDFFGGEIFYKFHDNCWSPN